MKFEATGTCNNIKTPKTLFLTSLNLEEISNYLSPPSNLRKIKQYED